MLHLAIGYLYKPAQGRLILNHKQEDIHKMLDTIFIHGIKVDCVIGVWKWEKAIHQTLVIDIDLATDNTIAAASDDLNDALNYQKITERVRAYAKENQFELIETLVEKLAEMILEEFATNWVRIKLDKGPAVKNVKQVGVVIERGSRD